MDTLTPEQQAAVEALNAEQLARIDQALRAMLSSDWRKMARIIGGAMMSDGVQDLQGIADLFYMQRLRLMVDAGDAEAVGDLTQMGRCELRSAAAA